MSAVTPSNFSAAQLRNRRLRNIAIGASVAFVAAMFYAITIVKMAPGILPHVHG